MSTNSVSGSPRASEKEETWEEGMERRRIERLERYAKREQLQKVEVTSFVA
jgi:hypothetical protein